MGEAHPVLFSTLDWDFLRRKGRREIRERGEGKVVKE